MRNRPVAVCRLDQRRGNGSKIILSKFRLASSIPISPIPFYNQVIPVYREDEYEDGQEEPAFTE